MECSPVVEALAGEVVLDLAGVAAPVHVVGGQRASDELLVESASRQHPPEAHCQQGRDGGIKNGFEEGLVAVLSRPEGRSCPNETRAERPNGSRLLSLFAKQRRYVWAGR